MEINENACQFGKLYKTKREVWLKDIRNIKSLNYPIYQLNIGQLVIPVKYKSNSDYSKYVLSVCNIILLHGKNLCHLSPHTVPVPTYFTDIFELVE